jgi:hypothetical protein
MAGPSKKMHVSVEEELHELLQENNIVIVLRAYITVIVK